MNHTFFGAMFTTGEVAVVDDGSTAMNHVPSVAPFAMAEVALIEGEAIAP